MLIIKKSQWIYLKWNIKEHKQAIHLLFSILKFRTLFGEVYKCKNSLKYNLTLPQT